MVAIDSQGKPSFRLLQSNLPQSIPIYCYACDLLNMNGELLVNFPLSSRREMLEDLINAPKDPIRLSPLLKAPTGQILDADAGHLRHCTFVGMRDDKKP
jgi:ATP-dependent DNA ligase